MVVSAFLSLILNSILCNLVKTICSNMKQTHWVATDGSGGQAKCFTREVSDFPEFPDRKCILCLISGL